MAKTKQKTTLNKSSSTDKKKTQKINKTNKNRATSIYVLKDPRTNEIRYVGKTCRTLHQRLTYHIWESKTHHVETHKAHGINSILAEGPSPIIEEIENVPGCQSGDREIYGIAYYSKTCKLTNSTPGGEGSFSYDSIEQRTKKTRQTIKAKRLTMYQYDLNGVYVGKCDIQTLSIHDYTRIKACCLHKSHRYGQYMYDFNQKERIEPYNFKMMESNINGHAVSDIYKELYMYRYSTFKLIPANAKYQFNEIKQKTNLSNDAICKMLNISKKNALYSTHCSNMQTITFNNLNELCNAINQTPCRVSANLHKGKNFTYQGHHYRLFYEKHENIT